MISKKILILAAAVSTGCAAEPVISKKGDVAVTSAAPVAGARYASSFESMAAEQKLLNLPSPADTRMAWDAFNHRGTIIWMCRGVTTEKFVKRSYCDSAPKVDSQWPSKDIPPNWPGVIF